MIRAIAAAFFWLVASTTSAQLVITTGVRGMLVARPSGTPTRTLSIAPGEHVDVAVSAPPTATVQIGNHVAYHQALVLRIGGRRERIERAGVFQFRPFRDPYY